MKVILALDAGTTKVKAVLVDRQANILARSSVSLAIHFPQIDADGSSMAKWGPSC